MFTDEKLEALTPDEIKELTISLIEGMSMDELKELKTKIASFIKSKKEGEKEQLALEKENHVEWAKENLEVDDIVIFNYKGEKLEGQVTKLNEKSFTVAFEYEGEDKVLSRLYHLLVNKVSEKEEVA